MTEDAVRATFGFLAGAPTGSELVFTFLRRDFLDGQVMFGAEAGHREFVTKRQVWKFGLMPDEVGDFLEPYGWEQGGAARAGGVLQPLRPTVWSCDDGVRG